MMTQSPRALRSIRTTLRDRISWRTNSCVCQQSKYHSYEFPAASPFTPYTESILSAAVRHVRTSGFTQKTLQLGAKDAGYLSLSTNIFPRGVFDLIMFYLMKQRLELEKAVNSHNGLASTWNTEKIGIGSRVRSLMLHRLKLNHEAGIVNKWPEALAIMAQPSYISPSLAELARLADDIWFLVGDTSVDSSWYTKRGSLATIYAATEVFQTQDASPDFSETERFLDSRLRDFQTMGSSAKAITEWTDFTAHNFINILRSKGVRI